MPVSILNTGSKFVIDRASSDSLSRTGMVDQVPESLGGVNHNIDIKTGAEFHIPTENMLGSIVPVVPGGISKTVTIAGRGTGKLDNATPLIVVVDIGDRSTAWPVVKNIPSGGIAVFGIFVDGAGRWSRLSAAPVQTSRKFTGQPGVAEDRFAVGRGGVGGDVDVECRIASTVYKIGNVDFGGMVDDGQSDGGSVGPAIVVFGLIVKCIGAAITGVGSDSQVFVAQPFERDKCRNRSGQAEIGDSISVGLSGFVHQIKSMIAVDLVRKLDRTCNGWGLRSDDDRKCFPLRPPVIVLCSEFHGVGAGGNGRTYGDPSVFSISPMTDASIKANMGISVSYLKGVNFVSISTCNPSGTV